MYRLTRLSLDRPRAVLLVLAVITVALGGGLPNLRTEFGYRVLVGDAHPAMRTLDRFVRTFGGALPAQIVWECGAPRPCESALDATSLGMAHSIVEELRLQPFVEDVTAVSNAPLLVPAPGGFKVRHFVEQGVVAPDALELAARAIGDPLWVGTLISEDARVGAIIVQPIDNESKTELRLVEALEAIVEEQRSNGFELALVGDSVAAVISGRLLAESMARLVPFTLLVIGLVVFLLTRSWLFTGASLVSMGLALLWTFGLLAWLDWPQDGILEILAPLVLTVGVCDAVHLLSRYSAELAESPSPGAEGARTLSMLRAARDVAPACLITTLTTGGAFLSFATSRLETFVRFGTISAFGVFACLVTTFTLLPILTRRLPAAPHRSRPVSSAWDASLGAIVGVTERRARPILLAAFGLLVSCGTGWALYLRVDANFFEIFGENSEVMQWTRFVEANLRPSDSLEVEVVLDGSSAVEAPESLAAISGFADFLSGLEGLGGATSLVDLVSRVNRLMNEDDPRFDVPAPSRAGNAEILELIAFEDSDFLGRWLSLDRSRVRVSVNGAEQPYSSREEVLRATREYASTHLPADWDVHLTGEMAINVDWIREVQGTQLRSFPAAFLIVFLMVLVFLRSWSLAVGAMIPTLVPVVITLGAMGWMGMSLDVGRSMVAAVVIGIGVDDAIHLMSRFRVYRAGGDSPSEAIRKAMLHVGRAVVTTSLALALGLLTLMASAWQTISSFGFFVALAILGALAATLFVLPALIFVFAGHEGDEEEGRMPRPVGPAAGRRGVVALVALLPVAGAIGGSVLLAATGGTLAESACWVLPNARVMPGPGDEECPLSAGDSIRGIQREDGSLVAWTGVSDFVEVAAQAPSAMRVAVQRDGSTVWVDVPIERHAKVAQLVRASSAGVVAVALLAIPLLLLRHSRSPAAAPLLLFFSAVAVITVVAMSAASSEWMTRLAVMAMVAIPAILVHLNLTFWRGRSLIRETPGFVLVPYGLSSILLPAGWFALERDPLLWPAFIYLLIALTAAGAGILLLSCVFAIRESSSPLERRRASVLLYGSLLLPVLPALFLARDAAGPSEAFSTYLWVAAVAMPFPIGLAISRNNLFDLGDQLRRTVTRTLFFAAGAALVTLAYQATRWSGVEGGGVLLFAVAFACMVAVEGLRRRFIGYLEARVSPRVGELRRTGQRFFEQVSELREPPEVAKLLGETLQEGLRARAVCVFLTPGSAWRPVYAGGESPPAQLSLAEEALSLLGGRATLQLLEGPEDENPTARSVAAAGVELIVGLRREGEQLGLALISESRSASTYTGAEITFATWIAEQASLALHNSRLAEDLVAAELQASTARVALTLVHQLGKELDWIRGLAKHLPSRLSDPVRAERDARRIRDLTDDVARRARGFLEDSSAGARRQPGTRSLLAVVDRSVQLVGQRFGPGRVTQTIAPGLEWVMVEDSVEAVLLNLLDNALRASPQECPVHLLGAQEGDWLVITVADRGCGMALEVLGRCFDFGFSTRQDGEGHGFGLAVSKETVEGLGGSLDLESTQGQGTRATLRLPLAGQGRS